jgi:hypothetical protein
VRSKGRTVSECRVKVPDGALRQAGFAKDNQVVSAGSTQLIASPVDHARTLTLIHAEIFGVKDQDATTQAVDELIKSFLADPLP